MPHGFRSCCGLVRASFVPEPAIQELRGLLRTRKQLVREKASHVQRLQKTLEEANIKLETVLSDVMGAVSQQGRSDLSRDPARGLHRICACPRRPSSPLLQNLIVGTDTARGAGAAAVCSAGDRISQHFTG